jgi:hypothetical protein
MTADPGEAGRRPAEIGGIAEERAVPLAGAEANGASAESGTSVKSRDESGRKR